MDAGADPRVARSTRAIGRALVELVQAKDFENITIQEILARARVGRATFYAHFRNKDDALHSTYERVFGAFDELLPNRAKRDHRLFPVAEFATHVSEAGLVVARLRESPRYAELWQAGVAYAARTIEWRLTPMAVAPISAPRRQLIGRMLAGAMMEAVQWWLDHPGVTTPEQLDRAFHRLARAVLT